MLVTFGDSWVYGVGAGYSSENPVTEKVYKEKRVSEEYLNCSFRILLAKKLGIKNTNFFIFLICPIDNFFFWLVIFWTTNI